MSIGSHVRHDPDPALTAARGRLASAMAAAVATTAGPGGIPPTRPSRATGRKRAAEWLRIGAALSDHVGSIAARADLAVEVRPQGTRAGARAAFYPDQSKIEIDAKAFGKLDPASIDPDITSDRERYPAAWGALTHEAAHARHTRWRTPNEHVGSAAAEVAEMLEEARAESRLLASRPADDRWLQACVTDLVLPEFPAALPDSPWAAAWAAGLITARTDAGILPQDLARPVETAARRVLGRDKLDRLRAIWSAARTVEDEDAHTMLHLGAAWCEVLELDAQQPAPAPDPSSGQPGGPGHQRAAQRGRVTAAVRRSARKIAKQAAEHVPSPKARERERVAQAAQIGKKIFGAPAPDPNDTRTRTPITGTRKPTDKEKAAAARLGRTLRQAGTRERQEIRTALAAPPGRLAMRAALARAAQRAAGAPPTAQPWVHTTRKALPNPPLRVGIAVDVSGSMNAAAGPLASAAWILANAAHLAGPGNESAACAFGSQVTAITRPGKPPALVTEFDARPSRHRISEAIDALETVLDLSAPGSARLLVIVSDGHFEPAEVNGTRNRIKRLTAAGCAVLWLDLTGQAVIPPAATGLVLTDPADAPTQIGKAAARALAAAR